LRAGQLVGFFAYSVNAHFIPHELFNDRLHFVRDNVAFKLDRSLGIRKVVAPLPFIPGAPVRNRAVLTLNTSVSGPR
jgi:hypothetical protein